MTFIAPLLGSVHNKTNGGRTRRRRSSGGRGRTRCKQWFGTFPLLMMMMMIVATNADSGFDGKSIPEKGDNECLSIEQRYEQFANGGDPSVWLDPCSASTTTTAQGETNTADSLPDNGFVLQVFTSLPAYGSDYGMYILHNECLCVCVWCVYCTMDVAFAIVWSSSVIEDLKLTAVF
jgi:hypothetical protein